METEESRVSKYIVARSDGAPIPPGEPCWVFRAKDALAAPAIEAYRNLAVAAGLPGEFISEVDAHIDRIRAWQAQHGAKLPD